MLSELAVDPDRNALIVADVLRGQKAASAWCSQTADPIAGPLRP